MRTTALILCLLTAASVFAQENFATHPAAVYPPGCVTLSGVSAGSLPGESLLVAEGVLLLVDPEDQEGSNVTARVYRQGCSESGRSVIKVTLEVISGGRAPVPLVEAQIGGVVYPMRLTSDPNSYTAAQSRRTLFANQVQEFFLDGASWEDLQAPGGQVPVMTPEQYNGSFELHFVDVIDLSTAVAPVPAYDNTLRSDSLPLNGRLSGTWVTSGVPDQGFLLAFEELADGANFLFLSWYTYDADGQLLWLTAGDRYDLGDDRIDLNLDLVTNGEFLGPKLAEREVAGTATLIAVSCNLLEFSYDLTELGLGSGTVELQRLFSLETAGFACRDQAAREATADG